MGQHKLNKMRRDFEELSIGEKFYRCAMDINFYLKFLQSLHKVSVLQGKQNDEEVIIITLPKSTFSWDEKEGLRSK